MIHTAKAIGANTDHDSSQAFIFLHQNLKIGLLVSGAGDNAFLTIKAVCAEVDKNLPDTAHVSEIFNSIKTQLSEKLAELNPHFLLSAWHDDILYLYSTGQFSAHLFRNQKPVELIGQTINQLISGHIQPGDRLLLTSKNLETFLEQIHSLDNGLTMLIDSPAEDFPAQVHSLVLDHPDAKPMSCIQIALQREVEKIPDLSKSIDLSSKPKFSLPWFVMPQIHLFRRQKRLLIFGVSLISIIILTATAIFFLRNIRTSQTNDQSLAQIQSRLDQATLQKDTDRQSAANLISEARSLLNQAKTSDPKNPKLLEYEQSLTQLNSEVTKTYQVSDWPVFLSLDLIKPNFSPKRISSSENQLLLLDRNQKSLVKLSVPGKSNSIVAGPTQLGDARYVSLNGDFAFAFSEKGIVRIDVTNNQSKVIVKPDSTWGNIADLVGFASNVYLLDTTKNQIWKYLPIDSGYSDANSYFKADTKPNLGSAKQFLIDGSVWILHADGTIFKYTSGSSDFFSYQGLGKNIAAVSSFYTSDETKNLYLLDPSNQRLVVVDKTGKYQSQYQGDKFATASDLVVNESNKKIYLLEGDKIYQLDLK